MGTKYLAGEVRAQQMVSIMVLLCFYWCLLKTKEFPRCLSGKGSTCSAGDTRDVFDPWVKGTLEMKIQPTPVFLAWGNPHGQEPGGLQSMDRKESDTAELTDNSNESRWPGKQASQEVTEERKRLPISVTWVTDGQCLDKPRLGQIVGAEIFK